MALTPEDVVNKRFQPTKFREGYDQDEVDDFLDEVVVELRRLHQENEDLKQQLQTEGQGSDSRTVSSASAAQKPAPVAAVPTSSTPRSDVDDETESSNNLLQLARRLHEEHVREGHEKREALIAEGHATAARIVAEAEAKQRAQIGSLEKERTGLEQRIDDLRGFEREYRQKLRGYIEGQLAELDQSGAGSAGATSGKGAASFKGIA